MINILLVLFIVFHFGTRQALAEQKPTMKAIAEEEISGPIVVDEKNVRKLTEILRLRMSEKTEHFRILYDVKLKNNFYYATESLDVVLGEENTSARKILSLNASATVVPNILYQGALTPEQRLSLEESILNLQSAENPKINIAISDVGATYSISGADRDWVLSTQVDLSERIINMTTSGRYFQYGMITAFVIFVILIIWIPPSIMFRNRYDNKMREQNQEYEKTSLFRYTFRLKDPDLDSSGLGSGHDK